MYGSHLLQQQAQTEAQQQSAQQHSQLQQQTNINIYLDGSGTQGQPTMAQQQQQTVGMVASSLPQARQLQPGVGITMPPLFVGQAQNINIMGGVSPVGASGTTNINIMGVSPTHAVAPPAP